MEQKPVIESTKDAFKVTLPNINAIHVNANGPRPQSGIHCKGKTDYKEARILEKLVEVKRLIQRGKTRTSNYTLPN